MALFKRSGSRNAETSATIFIVDDEEPLLELAEAFLAPIGYDVRTFKTAEKALKEYIECGDTPPALVVTDYWMARMSGMDLIRECRQLHPGQKTILISGTVDGTVFADATVKPDQFVAKPYDVKFLMDLIQEMVAEAEAGH